MGYLTKEEKLLLLEDLSERIPYVPYLMSRDGERGRLLMVYIGLPIEVMYVGPKGRGTFKLEMRQSGWDGHEMFPMLRPFSSITNDELEEYIEIGKRTPAKETSNDVTYLSERIKWLNAHHFDHRNLIQKGLAVKVTEENNPYDEIYWKEKTLL